MAARHLMDAGLKSFAFWGAPTALHARQRRDAFVAELKGRGFGCSVFEEMLASFPLSETQLQLFRRWVDPLPKPVGMMCWYDYQVAVAVQACRQAGYSVPDDVALVGVDDNEADLILSPMPVTSIDVNPFKIGYKAMDVLSRMIRTGKRPARHILLPPGNLIARQSTDILAVDNPDLVAAMRFIQNNSDRPITVRDLLKAVPISRRSLEIQFKKVLGRTPRQQIQHAHIGRAKMLCDDFDLSLGETSELSGFGDQATFCRIFKRFEKCTPMQYRRRIKLARANGAPAK
jgi:LacI family transcriptional regulator